MTLVNKKGVDVSSNNGKVSFEKIKSAGYDFAMIRCGFGDDISEQDDTYWEENVRKCEVAGIPWGAYFYSYACNESQAKSELAHILRLLDGKKPALPVALDIEDADGYHASHGGWNYTNIDRTCRIILDGIKAKGYYPMLYTGFEEVENYISKAVSQGYDMWFAHWARKCGYTGENLSMWQYGGETNLLESNSISGVGVIDKNICYKDYPAIIKSGGFNGWKNQNGSTSTEEKKTAVSGITAAQAMSAARYLVGKDESPDECDIMAWYGGFDTDINEIACCCAGMMYLFFKVLNSGKLIPGGKVADCGSLALNFYEAGQLHKASEVKPGDLVVFSWSGIPTSVKPLGGLGYKRFEHVELCLKVFDDTILSVGANNGGLECDDFQILTRSRSYISACCRPKYADGSSDADIEEHVSTISANGDTGVREVQTWLNSYYGYDIYIDGIYGSQTRTALTMALQTELNVQFGAGLAVDGICGSCTKSAIRIVSNGACGNYTKTLQGFLICNGYDTDGFDGIFGNGTENAVKQYQQDHGLFVDGIAGKATFGELCG
jgi:hypothetical protein